MADSDEAVAVCAVSTANSNSLVRWHSRLGHMNLNKMKELFSNTGAAFKTAAEDEDAINNCSACKAGHLRRLPVKQTTNTRATVPLERIHVDLWGPAPITSSGHGKYVLTITDDATRYSFVELISMKSDAPERLVTWMKCEMKHTGRAVKFIRTDSESIFTSKELKQPCIEIGVKFEYSPPYKHQYNGLVSNRTVFF